MKHPYTRFEHSPLWELLEREIAALEENGDLTLSTTTEHVVGYLCQALARTDLVRADAALPESAT